MKDITIHYAGGQITLRPEFLPAPRTALLKVLHMAELAGEADEVAAWARETLDGRAGELPELRKAHEQKAAEAKAELQTAAQEKALAHKAGDVTRYKDLHKECTKLRDRMMAETSAARACLRQAEMLKRNEEVIEAWEQQRKTL